MIRALTTSISAMAVLGLPQSASANTAIDLAIEEGNLPPASEFARFAPRRDRVETHIDYAAWDLALDWFVLPMGPSLREGAPRRSPSLGSRVIHGQDSRYRMEGNRVAFSMLTSEVVSNLTAYREELEELGGKIDIARLPRNEQLAYWFNLHNVAVIERIALAYPVGSPRDIKIGNTPLDQAKFIDVDGIKMSPRDIRTKIVYPNWDDPRVIYGFWHGEIGGPSLQKVAYNGSNAGILLSAATNEFVNSLRGVQKAGDTLLVSELYNEAGAFYFPDFENDLREHITKFANDDVKSILRKTSGVETGLQATDIADLSKGDREADVDVIKTCTDIDLMTATSRLEDACTMRIPRAPLAAMRFVDERKLKMDKLYKRGLLGRVYMLEGVEIDPENPELTGEVR
ncbi:MAG: DUF547 domain-containing protein [Altererythrobacter sp.]|nr:DUF547 domain-containing protein [Altererythrobacter sp.]